MDNSWIHAFHKSISTIWKANSLIQELNSDNQVHYVYNYYAMNTSFNIDVLK